MKRRINMSEVEETMRNRRDFMGKALVVASITGATVLNPTRVEAARCPRLPNRRRSRERVPFLIQSELGTAVEGQLDLTTVESGRGRELVEAVRFDILLDALQEGTSVRGLTDKIEKLALVNPELHRPETALLTWGTGLAFNGILAEFHTAFTAFSPEGIPLRATMNVAFKVLDSCDLAPAPRR